MLLERIKIISFLCMLIIPIGTSANESKVPYEDWDSHFAEGSEGPLCYLYIYPREKGSSDFKRGNSLVFLIFNGFDPDRTEFVTEFGRSAVSPDEASLEIGGRRFPLAFRSNKAWLKDVDDEFAAYSFLKVRQEFSITLRYSNDVITDKYESKRFMQAMTDLKGKCRMGS